jgi:hypothetical protein
MNLELTTSPPGHCYCGLCIDKYKDAGGHECPSCRVSFKKDNGQKLFITFWEPDADPVDDNDVPASDGLSETVVKQVKYVTKGLGRMHAGSSLATVKKAKENLIKVADALESSGLVDVSVCSLAGLSAVDLEHTKTEIA